MDKWLFGYSCFALVIVVIAIIASVNRAYDADFAGQVIGKEHRQVALTTGVRHDLVLTIRCDNGAIVEFLVKNSVYDSFSVGDPIVKESGRRWPVKPSRLPDAGQGED